MIVENSKVISLTYELRLNTENADITEKVDSQNPMTFLYGHGNLLPEFEANLNGKKTGDTFSFSLSPDKAYGVASDEAIIDLPISVFEVNGQVDTELLQIGRAIPMMDQEGNRLNGTVVNLEKESVKMDFNHPLAGETLFFNGEITDIREATEEEIQHGHVHGEGGHQHGCGDENCEPTPGCGCGH